MVPIIISAHLSLGNLKIPLDIAGIEIDDSSREFARYNELYTASLSKLSSFLRPL